MDGDTAQDLRLGPAFYGKDSGQRAFGELRAHNLEGPLSELRFLEGVASRPFGLLEDFFGLFERQPGHAGLDAGHLCIRLSVSGPGGEHANFADLWLKNSAFHNTKSLKESGRARFPRRRLFQNLDNR